MFFKANKKSQKTIIASTTLVIASWLLWGISPVLAQNPSSPTIVSQSSQKKISQAELEQFANIYQQIQNINQETEKKMVEVIQKEGMSIQRFSDLVTWATDSQKVPNPAVTQAEMETFKKIIPQIAELQEQADGKINQVFQSQSLQVERYNEIYEAVSNDPNLLKSSRGFEKIK